MLFILWLCAQTHAAEPDHRALLASELEHAWTILEQQPEPAHYLALTLTREERVSIGASAATRSWSNDTDSTWLDVDLRVGTATLDSTHQLRGFSALDGDNRMVLSVPQSGEYAIRSAIRREIDQQYRDHAERIVMIRANQRVKIEEEDSAHDFSPARPGVVEHAPPTELSVDIAHWEGVLARLSDQIEESEYVHESSVNLTATRVTRTFVDSEQARLVHGRLAARISISMNTTAADGDQISVFESIDVHDPSSLPVEEELTVLAGKMLERLEAMLAAPRVSPFSGPVLLEGRASGVFFHEVFGHRVEGHRMKRESEGKTFAEYVGEPILPDFIDVVDDPTVASVAGIDLNGHYRWDDEGTPAQQAVLVDDGVFQGFLMSRIPIEGFAESNGHGRRSVGRSPGARMGNTIITASKTEDRESLRKKLRSYAREQGLEFGILVTDITGGFTMTGRVMPNAFNVRASTAYRIYVDGRPDEMVRGIDLVGTPLVAFSNLRAAGNEVDVFNGTCGAESGWVPVSAVAPDLLFERLEFQLKEKGQERPPLLDKPARDGASDAWEVMP